MKREIIVIAAVSWVLGVSLLAAPPGSLSDHIHVDQFGYPPDAKKIAVLADPQSGFNSGQSYTPAGTIELRRVEDDGVVFSGTPPAWNGGATHGQSGDKVWWFDFSSITKWGSYYVYDSAADVHSPPFRIHPEVYNQALYDAVRTFYYQRCAIAKVEPYADARWVDAASHLVDLQCRSANDQGNPATERDMSGGWYDAGDYNKYVNFTLSPVLQLVQAYRSNPVYWNRLRLDIPESVTSGLPDILDELKWELDWLLKMQNANGSVHGKVAVTAFQSGSPPSTTTASRYYGVVSTTATFSAAAMFAASALAFEKGGDATYAQTLESAAEPAWAWAVANPAVVFDNSPFQSANPEDGDFAYGVISRQLTAAVYLYEATGKSVYRDFVENNYTQSHLYQWWFVYPFEQSLQDALLHFTTLNGVDATVRDDILDRKQTSIQNSESFAAYTGEFDAYRAYLTDANHVWGSNRVKANMGLIFAWQNRLGLDPANATGYRDAAAGYLHYLHGTNPIGLVMLSNMGHAGASRSVDEFYHSWYADGTIYDNVQTSLRGPAPGFVPGGPNPGYHPDPVYAGPPIEPPQNQPVQKSYRQWNTSYPENSWEVTENGIYYQSAYIQLAAAFAGYAEFADWADDAGLASADPMSDADGDGMKALLEYVLGTDPTKYEGSPLGIDAIGGDVAVSFPIILRADIKVTLEASPDLNNSNWNELASLSRTEKEWSVAGGTGIVVTENGGLVTATMTADQPRFFVRLKVELVGLSD